MIVDELLKDFNEVHDKYKKEKIEAVELLKRETHNIFKIEFFDKYTDLKEISWKYAIFYKDDSSTLRLDGSAIWINGFHHDRLFSEIVIKNHNFGTYYGSCLPNSIEIAKKLYNILYKIPPDILKDVFGKSSFVSIARDGKVSVNEILEYNWENKF